MKKAAIITITDYLNYGNRLQNFAAQEILKSYKLEVESIPNFPVRIEESGMLFTINRIKNALLLSPATMIKKLDEKIYEKKNKAKYQQAQKAKQKSFRDYSTKHTTETSFTVQNNKMPENLGDQYDYFVIGSDQIWNPNIRWGNSFDFAQFAPRHKRVALAPSIGVSHIDEQYQELYSKWLSSIDYLSVRENAGAKLIKELCGKDVPVLIDPTLMISREQWLSVSETHAFKPKKAYLLTYFIGTVSRNRRKILNELAEQYNLEIVQLASLEDVERYSANPGEFVDYVNSANIVCTDSFHAIIFSMLMRKPFVVFDREGKSKPMNSRIETLLGKFQFEGRMYSALKPFNSFMSINYSKFEQLLVIEQQKVNDFLKTALN
jgi:hypothetical protein